MILTPLVIVGGAAGLAVTASAPAYADAGAVSTIIASTNSARADYGLAGLVHNTAMDSVAQQWADHLAATHDHSGAHNPDAYTQIPPGWTLTEENVTSDTTGNVNPGNVVSVFMGSSSHKAAILSNSTDIGIGYAVDDVGATYYVQEFANYPSTVIPPSRPSQPAVTTVGNGIQVQFAAPSQTGNGTLSYDIMATPLAGGSSTQVSTSGSPYILTGLVPGANYQIQVRAKNSAGAGAWSNAANGTAPATAPSAAYNINIVPQLTSVDLNWTSDANGSAITTYTVVLNGLGTINPGTAAAHFDGLRPGTHYTGSITATNGIGTSPVSNFAFDTPITVPDAPVNLHLNSNAGSTDVTASWADGASDGGSAVTSYNLTISTTPNDASAPVVTENNQNHTFTGLKKGTTYYVTVASVNPAGASTTVSGQVTVPATPPSVAGNVTATLTDEQQITVTWNAPTDDGGSALTNYVVNVYANGSVTPTFSKTVDPASTTLVLTAADGINANTTYKVDVQVLNGVGSTKSAKTSDVVVPATPTHPDAVSSFKATNVALTDITVTWDAPYNGGAAITGYVVTVDDANGNVVDQQNLSSTDNSHTFTGLQRGTNYVVHVTAQNNRGSSDDYNINVKTLIEAPLPANTVDAQIQNHNTLVANWTAPNDNGGAAITGYRVELYKGATKVTETTTSNLTASFTGLDYGTTYHVVVYASNVQFESQGSSSADVTTPTAPDAVTNLIVTPTDAHSANVTWDTPASSGTYPLAFYDVALVSVANNTIVGAQSVDGSTNSVAFGGLNPGGSYYAVVTPWSEISGPTTNSATVRTPAVAPDAPASINLSLDGSTAIKATWTAPSYTGGANIDYYLVTLKDANNNIVANTKAAGFSLTFPNLNPASTYSVTIAAVNIAGAGNGVGDSINTNAIEPTAPGSVDAVIGNPTNTVDVAWTAPASNGGSTISNYTVILKDNKGNVVNVYLADGAELTHSFTNVPRGVSYHVDVNAINGIGNSPVTTSATVAVPAVAPTVPVNVNISHNGAVGINASWSAPTDNGGAAVSSYIVTVYNNSDQSVVNSKTVAIPSASFAGLEPVTEYVVGVVAVNAAGQSSEARSLPLTTLPVAPGAATGVALTVGNPDTTLVANWVAPASNGGAAVTYDVVLRKNSEVVNTLNTADLTSSWAGLTRGATYTVTVTAKNSAGSASPVTSTGTVVPAVAPDAPVNAAAITSGTQSIKVTWAAPAYNGGAAIIGYKVYLNSSVGNKIVTAAADATSINVTNLEADTTYTVAVTAVNGAGESVQAPVSGQFLTAPAGTPAAPSDDEIAAAKGDNNVVLQGAVLTATLPAGSFTPGTWVFGYAHSTPTALGWAQVASNGVVTFSIANAGLPVGNHTLVVLNPDGTVNSKGAFAVAAPPVTPGGNNGGNSSAGSNGNGTTTAGEATKANDPATSGNLASTGSNVYAPLALGSGLLALGILVTIGVAYLRRRRDITNS